MLISIASGVSAYKFSLKFEKRKIYAQEPPAFKDTYKNYSIELLLNSKKPTCSKTPS